eukprot:Selendium_serpulae@DN3816_c0_g1_i1.p1
MTNEVSNSLDSNPTDQMTDQHRLTRMIHEIQSAFSRPRFCLWVSAFFLWKYAASHSGSSFIFFVSCCTTQTDRQTDNRPKHVLLSCNGDSVGCLTAQVVYG